MIPAPRWAARKASRGEYWSGFVRRLPERSRPGTCRGTRWQICPVAGLVQAGDDRSRSTRPVPAGTGGVSVVPGVSQMYVPHVGEPDAEVGSRRSARQRSDWRRGSAPLPGTAWHSRAASAGDSVSLPMCLHVSWQAPIAAPRQPPPQRCLLRQRRAPRAAPRVITVTSSAAVSSYTAPRRRPCSAGRPFPAPRCRPTASSPPAGPAPAPDRPPVHVRWTTLR